MRHVLSMLVTAMLVWCGLVQPAHAAVAMPLASVTTAYTHDSNDSPCLVTDRFEGPPPATYDRSADHTTVDVKLRSVSAYLETRSTYTHNGYDLIARFAQVDSADVAGEGSGAWLDSATCARPVGAAKGGLQIVGEGFSASERAMAEQLASQGRNVVLRQADSAAGRTSDLLLDGT